MKHFLLGLFLLLVTKLSFGQLDKGVWLVGGTGSLLSSKYEYTSPTLSFSSDRLNIGVAPNIGYFVADKLALGLRMNYSKNKDQVNGAGGGYSNVNRFSLGPSVRYYLLDKESRYNLLTEINYQYGLYSFKPTKGNSNTFNALVGPVIYLNTSVGLEFLVGYYSTTETIKQIGEITTKQNGFQFSIGFQIHLEKN